MMKFSTLAFPIAVLMLAACTPANSTTGGDASSSLSSVTAVKSSSVSSVGMTSSTATSPMAHSSVSSAMVRLSEGISASVAASVSIAPTVTKIVKITASNFTFTPNAIRVKKGDKVIIRLTGSEGIHGFGVPDLGINQRVAPGESHDIALDTSTAGSYSFFCTVPCGPGHKQMTGTIVIE